MSLALGRGKARPKDQGQIFDLKPKKVFGFSEGILHYLLLVSISNSSTPLILLFLTVRCTVALFYLLVK